MTENRTNRQNEVWAGKTVNMAAKLASLSHSGELLVSDRFYNQITHKLIRKCCKCSTETDLWQERIINDSKFDFNTIYELDSKWCPIHGEKYCKEILKLD